jgi:hypothetical protein
MKNNNTDPRKKDRFSSEYTMLSILEYMCTSALNIPLTKYHILTKVPDIKQQRPDRIAHIMNTFERNGFIKSIKTSNSIGYQAAQCLCKMGQGFFGFC